MRGDGTIALGATPTVGNLMVLVIAGWGRNMERDSNHFGGQFRPTSGWSFVGNYRADENNAVACWLRRVRSGDAGSIALNGTDNHSSVLYEFEDALTVYPIGGGPIAIDFTGNNFAIEAPKSPFGVNDPVIGAFEHDTTPVWSFTAETGLVVDYVSPASADNHTGGIVRLLPTHDRSLAGSLSGSPVNPVSGFFAVVGDFS